MTQPCGAGQLATGWLSDHWGCKPFVTAGMVTQAAGLAVIASSQAIPGWAIGSVLLGAGTAMVYPTPLAVVIVIIVKVARRPCRRLARP